MPQRWNAMARGRAKQLIIGLTAFMAIGIFSTCARERGVEWQPTRHTLYVSTNTYAETGERIQQLYFLDADSLTIFDSLPLLLTAGAASPDGRSLYLTVDNYGQPYLQDTTYKLDLQSMQRVWSIAEGIDIRLADGGRVIFRRAWPRECATLMVSSETGAILRRINGPCELGEAPESSQVIPAVVSGDGTRPTWDSLVHLIDVRTGDTRWTIVPRQPDRKSLRLSQTVLHPDGERLLAIGECGSASCLTTFLVCDVRTGVPLLSSPLHTLTGDIAVSADGRYAVVSNPDYAGFGPQFVDVFDLDTYERVKRFDLGSGLHPNGFGDLQFLPDDRRVVVAPNVGGPLQVIDLSNMSVGEPFWLPPDTHPFPEVWTMFLGPRR